MPEYCYSKNMMIFVTWNNYFVILVLRYETTAMHKYLVLKFYNIIIPILCLFVNSSQISWTFCWSIFELHLFSPLYIVLFGSLNYIQCLHKSSIWWKKDSSKLLPRVRPVFVFISLNHIFVFFLFFTKHKSYCWFSLTDIY